MNACLQIMSMIQRGEKPSNIREINDAPPNPNQPLTNPRAAPRPKPWEVSQPQSTSVNTYPSQEISNGTTYHFQDNQSNGDDGVPWWQKKNVRITEVESSEEHNFGSSNMPATNNQPPQRSWVPPQPPPVVIPEAAVAIRQPKKAAVQAEPMNDDQFLARSGDATDELQKITRYSETAGGSVEASSGFSDPSSTEIQREEDNGSYLET